MSTFNIPSVSATDLLSGRATFNVPGALALLYGITGLRTYPGVVTESQERTPDISYGGIEVVEEEDAPLSYIGTPILFPVTFKGGGYNRYDRQGRIEQTQMQDLRLPATTVVEMARPKAITKTAVVSGTSSVKEIYGMDDWTVRLSGFLLDETNHPQGLRTLEQMQERLIQWFDLADSIEVDAALFNGRGIHRLTLKDISFNQFPGFPRKHGFQIQAESDDPLELIIQ